MRVGTLALINPVKTSTDGRCVAKIKWIPAALAFCAKRAINSSTFLPTTIIMSANSSITMTILGNFSRTGKYSPSSSGFSILKIGSRIVSPLAVASSIK